MDHLPRPLEMWVPGDPLPILARCGQGGTSEGSDTVIPWQLRQSPGPRWGTPEPAPNRLNIYGTRKGKWPRVSAEPEGSCCSAHPLSEFHFTDEETEAQRCAATKLEGGGTGI